MGTVIDASRLADSVYFGIARDCYDNALHFNKFGYNDTLGGLGNPETIWDGGGLYSYIQTAGTASVAGSGVDVGATINIQGLDANYNLINEDVVVGQTSNKSWIRIFRALIVNHLTSNVNANDITVTVDGAVRAKIMAGNGQTLMALITVPAGYTGYLTYFQGTTEEEKFGSFKIIACSFSDNGVLQTKGMFGAWGAPVTYDYKTPIKFTEKTDIEIRADIDTSKGAGAIFDIVFIKD